MFKKVTLTSVNFLQVINIGYHKIAKLPLQNMTRKKFVVKSIYTLMQFAIVPLLNINWMPVKCLKFSNTTVTIAYIN